MPKDFVVFGVGEPLFDTSAVVADGAPDLWVTLSDSSSNLGVTDGARKFDHARKSFAMIFRFSIVFS